MNNENYNIIKNHTLFILDWDDTLFPTNWVIKNNIDLLNINKDEYMTKYFCDFDELISKLLTKLLCLGEVVIITNAMSTWIELSSIVLPKTKKILHKILLISTRDIFKDTDVAMNVWKINMFNYVFDTKFKNKKYANIISVGDAEYEYKALISLEKKNIKKHLKTIRFAEMPHDKMLYEQLNMLNENIFEIWKSPEYVEMKFENT